MPEVPKKFNYGGQAVIEGVMIRGRTAATVACRRPNGETVTDCQPLPSLYTGPLRQAPFVRGVIVLIETLALGTKALMFSANVALEEEGEEVPERPQASGLATWTMMPIAFAIAIAVFFISPLMMARVIDLESAVTSNVVEGIIRLGLFVAYLAAINLMPDMRRVFAYHGAEHMTIAAHEHGSRLEVAEIRKYPKEHPRCGTAFILTVVVVAVVVFTVVGIFDPPLWLLAVSRIALLPIIAAVSYEIIRFNAAHENDLIGKVGMAPGLWLQYLTTRKPDDPQIEVALTAMEEALRVDSEAPPVQNAASVA